MLFKCGGQSHVCSRNWRRTPKLDLAVDMPGFRLKNSAIEFSSSDSALSSTLDSCPSRLHSMTLSARSTIALRVWRQAQDHRCDRIAGGDRAHSHALGVVGSTTAADAGAARRTVSGSLIVGFGPVLPSADG
jgi:hypothetical protein